MSTNAQAEVAEGQVKQAKGDTINDKATDIL